MDRYFFVAYLVLFFSIHITGAMHLDTRVINAVLDENLAAIGMLLSSKAHVDAADACGLSALRHAIHTGNSAIVQQLLRAHADVNAADYVGHTPLMHAAIRGNKTIITMLLQAGAARGACDANGHTAYMHAHLWERADLAELLSHDTRSASDHEPVTYTRDETCGCTVQ
jgi:ankyrin repeat protein